MVVFVGCFCWLFVVVVGGLVVACGHWLYCCCRFCLWLLVVMLVLGCKLCLLVVVISSGGSCWFLVVVVGCVIWFKTTGVLIQVLLANAYQRLNCMKRPNLIST